MNMSDFMIRGNSLIDQKHMTTKSVDLSQAAELCLVSQHHMIENVQLEAEYSSFQMATLWHICEFDVIV